MLANQVIMIGARFGPNWRSLPVNYSICGTIPVSATSWNLPVLKGQSRDSAKFGGVMSDECEFVGQCDRRND